MKYILFETCVSLFQGFACSGSVSARIHGNLTTIALGEAAVAHHGSTASLLDVIVVV